MRSLFIQILECCGVIKLVNYRRMSLSDPKPERIVKEKGLRGEHNSFFVTPKAHSEKPSLLLMFALDASVSDTQADRYHHTNLNIGNATTGLRNGIEIHGSKKNEETGKFEPLAKLEFDYMFPQLSDDFVKEYLTDRMTYGKAKDELDKFIKKMKDLGLIPKRPYNRNPEAEETFRIDSEHETISIITPKSERLSWKGVTNKAIKKRYRELVLETTKIVIKWRALSGLGHRKVKDEQVLRVIDLGLYESARIPANLLEIKKKNFPVYVNKETFEEYVAKGRIEIKAADNGEKVSGVLLVAQE